MMQDERKPHVIRPTPPLMRSLGRRGVDWPNRPGPFLFVRCHDPSRLDLNNSRNGRLYEIEKIVSLHGAYFDSGLMDNYSVRREAESRK